MSVLVGGALPSFLYGQQEWPAVDPYDSGREYCLPLCECIQVSNPTGTYDYSSPWWPAQGGLAGDCLSDTGAGRMICGPALTPAWGTFWVNAGCNGRLGFVGVTRDQYGSPLGGCTVRCFVTATDELVSKVTSDAKGNYIATSPYQADHYLVIHSSDGQQAGASVSTIDPS